MQAAQQRSWVLYLFIAALFLALAMHASAELRNPGFEDGDLTGWEIFGTGWRLSEDMDAYRGVFGAVNDVLGADDIQFRGLHQDLSVTEGEIITLTAYIRAVNVESSESWLEIQFMDEHGQILDQKESVHVRADQSFTHLSVTGQAPQGARTVSARGVVLMREAPEENDDFHIFDNFRLIRVQAQDQHEM